MTTALIMLRGPGRCEDKQDKTLSLQMLRLLKKVTQ